MAELDIRWHQRLYNFGRALAQLERFVARGEDLNELEEQGLIQAFEYNFELAWTVIKDYYAYQGMDAIRGSRDAFRLAYQYGLITEGGEWMRMIESRIKTVHTYNRETAREIAHLVRQQYAPCFRALYDELKRLKDLSTE